MQVESQHLERMAVIPAIAQPTFKFLKLAEVHESELNPRKTFNQVGLEELAQSIRESGVWTPITARPREGDWYEIAAGHRRFRAAHMAGLTEIPAIVRPMTDQEFTELITFENLGREDVHPLEEASGFQLLIAKYGYTPVQIAEKIGCGEGYVHKRLHLARLIKPAHDSFASGEISLNHAILISRLDPDKQKEAFAFCFEDGWHAGKREKIVVSSKVLDLRIKENLFLNLSSAPWKKDDAVLVPKAGACSVCPKRTGANHLLFDDVAKGDNCLDVDCFDRKRQAFIRITTVAHAKETGKAMARVATRWCSDAKKLDCLQDHSYTKIKKDRCEHAQKAIVVYGDNLGQVIDICAAAKCTKHGAAAQGQYGSYKRTEKEIAAEQKRKTDAKIDAAYRQALWSGSWVQMQEDGELDANAVEVIAHYLIERIGHDGRGPLVKALDLKPETKTKSQGYEDTNSKLLRAYFAKIDSLDKQLMFLLALATAPALGNMYTAALKTLEKVSADSGLDHSALKRNIAAPILATAKKRADNEKKKAAEAKKAAPVKAKPAKVVAVEEPEEEDDDYESDGTLDDGESDDDEDFG